MVIWRKLVILLIIIVSYNTEISSEGPTNYHGKGFIIYCPCMGRFGNQAEQLLGSLLFAKSLNRTLILPPFINYGLDHIPELIPFESIVQVEPINEYNEVMLLTEFMAQHVDSVWPPGERQFFCYSARDIKVNNYSCDSLKGQPFSTFWAHFNISEDKSVFYKPLTTNPHLSSDWKSMYPPSTHPVLTFVGAPSPFPAYKESIKIQKYIKIADDVKKKAIEFKKVNDFLNVPYLSIHIRHGSDWRKACDLLRSNQGLTQLFSSNQCTGYPLDGTTYEQKLQFDTCLPSFDTIVSRLNETLNTYKIKRGIELKVVHIATDFNDRNLWKQLREFFPLVRFTITASDHEIVSNTMIDIYLMTYAEVFIGNCISSFSAFPARIRSEQLHLETFYFGQDFSNPVITKEDL